MRILRETRSVCPKCLKNLPAQLVEEDGRIYMRKECSEHGSFSTVIWHGKSSFDDWRGNVSPLGEKDGLGCPENCGICREHLQGTCCVLLEVTRRCNLHCRFCFADGEMPEPTLAELKRAVDDIFSRGKPTIQLSGGEPTLRNDLPELIQYIKLHGGKYIQLNTNGLRLADDERYVKSLAAAGLSYVFLQFDGVTDNVYLSLRGEPLFERKQRAIELCARHGIGVTLVPTVVRGVNDQQIGDIVQYAVSMSPKVRGIHFQPVSYFGRYPHGDNEARYTLDELIAALGEQAEINERNIAPSRCDHPGCGFHASFSVTDAGELVSLTWRMRTAVDTMTTAEKTREYIGSRWSAAPSCCEPEAEPSSCCCDGDLPTLDGFLNNAKTRSFTITAMAFQDAMNLDVERLRRCSLHVYANGVLKPFCAAYLTGIGE